MVEKIKEVINDYQDGWIGAEHLVDTLHDVLMSMHVGTNDMSAAKDAALTPLANFICYLYSDENISYETLDSFNNDLTRQRFDGRFEMGCRITELELENAKLKEENEKLLTALQETSEVLADEAMKDDRS